MPKILFLDVDQTLVDNKTSEYNENLIQFICDQQFDQIYLVTGRNTNDFWQHVLQMGKKPQNWRNQLLCNLVDYFNTKGIKIAGVSTPYDHYLQATSTEHKDIKAGDMAQTLYMPFERHISEMQDEQITQETLVNKFNDKSKGRIYNDGFEGKDYLTNALPSYLASTGDVEKKGQFEFLLQRVKAENKGDLEIFFFDDKQENLDNAQKVFNTHSHVTSHVVLVDKVQGFKIPQNVLDSMISKTLDKTAESQITFTRTTTNDSSVSPSVTLEDQSNNEMPDSVIDEEEFLDDNSKIDSETDYETDYETDSETNSETDSDDYVYIPWNTTTTTTTITIAQQNDNSMFREINATSRPQAFFKTQHQCTTYSSSLSLEQESQINAAINQLKYESKPFLPFMNKDRKKVKIDGLNCLKKYAEKGMSVMDAVIKVIEEYGNQGLLDGKISKRTLNLLNTLTNKKLGNLLKDKTLRNNIPALCSALRNNQEQEQLKP